MRVGTALAPCPPYDLRLTVAASSALPVPVVLLVAPLRALLLAGLLRPLPDQHVVLDARAALPAGGLLALVENVEAAPARAAEARTQTPGPVLGAGHLDVGCKNCHQGTKSDQDAHIDLLCPADRTNIPPLSVRPNHGNICNGPPQLVQFAVCSPPLPSIRRRRL